MTGPCQEIGGQGEREVEMLLPSAPSLPGSGSAVAGLPYPILPSLFPTVAVPHVAPIGPGIDRLSAVAIPQPLYHPCAFPSPPSLL